MNTALPVSIFVIKRSCVTDIKQLQKRGSKCTKSFVTFFWFGFLNLCSVHLYIIVHMINANYTCMDLFHLQADIFSLALITFHVLTGVSPAGHDENIETNLNVACGDRPSFTFRGYTVQPNFKQMVEVMNTCWNENPNERPSASDVLKRMRVIDFLFLSNATGGKGTDACFCQALEMVSIQNCRVDKQKNEPGRLKSRIVAIFSSTCPDIGTN